MYQLHSIGGHPPPVQDCIAIDNNDDECPTAFFCCPCAFLQLAAEWRVRSCTLCVFFACVVNITVDTADRVLASAGITKCTGGATLALF